MSGDTLYQRPRRHNVAKIRVHDYLYDSAYIVSGAKDYARTAFRAAMASAQVIIQPVYSAMFSDARRFPSMHAVYHTNCRLPDHIDRSYGAYVQRANDARLLPQPHPDGRDRFMFAGRPRKVLVLQKTSPDFKPPTPRCEPPSSPRPKNRATQSMYRESSAQTVPWQPDGKAADACETTPEVLFLDKLEWGPGCPYRVGDLPADFHTTEIINKLRHARCWTELMEKGKRPGWMKKTDAIITDIETKDWIFREAEIDELQNIRLELLHRMQAQLRTKQATRTSRKLAKLWVAKKEIMEKKIDHVRKNRDRELRKLTALHGGGGRAGQVQRMKAARGSGSMTLASQDPKSELIAPLARHGYQARRRHECIEYDPTLLSYEDHVKLAEPPEWLERCGQDLRHTCSGHHLERNTMQLCERETKWSEQFLENLHNDLKKARLGAASTGSGAGPLRVLKPRGQVVTPRPTTPVMDRVDKDEEVNYQAALVLQRIVRGRAVQILMYEGRTQAAELTEELKTTHGLQKQDRALIARNEAKSREYSALRSEAEQTDAAITALVDELCGGAVVAALDFLEKELRRLKEERRQHAFILIALREKQMREAAEAGRRQKEEQRRREHDEMFRQILGVTQETVDAYFRDIMYEGVHLAAEQDAASYTEKRASSIDESLAAHDSMSTAEQERLVAELVQQFLLPEVHKTASRHRVTTMQNARLHSAREAIFGFLDDAEIKTTQCVRCGAQLGDACRCNVCPVAREPIETAARDDPRWMHTRSRPKQVRSTEERFPPAHDMRCLLSALLDDVVRSSRAHRAEMKAVTFDVGRRVRERTEATLDAKFIAEAIVDRATGASSPPLKVSDYHHFMMRHYGDALERSVPFHSDKCPKELPSELRSQAEALIPSSKTCKCDEEEDKQSPIKVMFEHASVEDPSKMLPSAVRALEEMRRCKCDSSPTMTGFDTIPTMSDFDSAATAELGDRADDFEE